MSPCPKAYLNRGNLWFVNKLLSMLRIASEAYAIILGKLEQFKPEFNKSVESIACALNATGRGSLPGKSARSGEINASNKLKAL